MFTGRKLPLTLAFVVLIGLAFGASCNGFFVDPVLTSISVGPNDQNLEVNDTLQMSARGTYDDGSTKNITGSVLWSSSDSTVASINKSGLVTGVSAPGSTTISASLDTISNTATVNVVLTGVTAITISPAGPVNVQQGGSQDFTCTATVTGQANPIDVTAQVTWSTSDTTNTDITNGENPALFTVNSGTASEQVTVTAKYSVGSTNFSDTVTVNVTQ